jgi:protein involved in sex pheromone biosynthesis
MNRKITAENLKNLNDGETIETPRGTFNIERFCDQINLYKNGKLVSRDYLSEYLSNDGSDKAWKRLYNHRVKWLNWELCY